jgi:hypothetical protein
MVDKDKVLRFLQKCKFDMMREVPGFIDAHIARNGSASVTLRVSAPLATPPSFLFEGDEIPVDVSVDFPDAKPAEKVVVMNGLMDPVAILPQSPPKQVGTVATPDKVAISPHEGGARDQAAFEAWKRRHSAIKIG